MSSEKVNPWAQSAPVAADPWAEAAANEAPAAAVDPWGGGGSAAENSDWLTSEAATQTDTSINFLNPFEEGVIPLGDWVELALQWLVDNFRAFFQAIRWPIDTTLNGIESALLAVPHGSPQAILVIAFATLVALLIWPGDSDQLVAAPDTKEWPLFVTLGVVGGGLSFLLYIVGLRCTTPITASIVAMVEPVTASLFGVMVLNESLAGSQFLGMGLILVSVTGLSVLRNVSPLPRSS